MTIQIVIQPTQNRHFSEILNLLSMFRKRVETKQGKDYNPQKHTYNCAVIVLGENVPRSKRSLTTLLCLSIQEPLATYGYLN